MAINQTTKKSRTKTPASDSILEALRDIGGSATSSVKKDIFEGIPQDFFNQAFGYERKQQKASGDLVPGQSIEFDQVLEEQKEENKVLRSQLSYEQSLRHQEQTLVSRQSQELKVQIQALAGEVTQLAKTTQGLARETQIAAMQAPANPGVYHVNFFEKLRSYIVSFRRKIENASLWMQSYNTRSAKKKGFWGQVGRSGAKRLLSSEDYLQRSAG
ncbi:MAG: hypothetical protein A3F61_01310 [Candidatus Blackburnbacteria bacterium RIFCSPHIGHO2_12_FULL_41_13b]|uniref:DUF5660 domain-containing protein n=1 Tax=Candidatus Blackburnbacteria bacterium RIFCSPHIGHO2_12_FULL_41_13b TaxID=1797517 RepID=A0A1G1VAF3_9BACT|nr:MAG: hypothetical protein A3F61_01310 [Candidatus Blackburnbacteria bacterium RIFCSPHIGHO2_12_FULL_41_13b]